MDKKESILVLGDGTEMPDVPDGEAALVLTSPPYNVGMPYEGYDDDIPWDEYRAWLSRFLGACYRVLRVGGCACVNMPLAARKRSRPISETKAKHPRHRNPEPYRQPLDLWVIEEGQKAGLLFRDRIIWVKGDIEGEAWAFTLACGSDNNPNFRQACETLVLLQKGSYVIPGRTGRWARMRSLNGEDMPMPLDWFKNVWFVPPGWATSATGKINWHPSPWPPEIPSRLIYIFTNPGELVVDPFAGTGIALRIAVLLGRRAMGYEISEQYYRRAKEYLSQGILI